MVWPIRDGGNTVGFTQGDECSFLGATDNNVPTNITTTI